jgi:hypothetical protein
LILLLLLLLMQRLPTDVDADETVPLLNETS